MKHTITKGCVALLALALLAACQTGASTPLRVANIETIEKLTGAGGPNATDTRYQVVGVDLGIIWDNNQGQVLVAFGDTFGQDWGGNGGGGGGPGAPDWRSNVLGISSDHDLADGMQLDSMIEDRPGHAGEILSSEKINFREITVIPTAAIAVGTRQYIHYMSVNSWGKPGVWFTNYSGIAYSDDNGRTWTKDANTRWENSGTWTDHFQMAALARDGGYIYMFTTPNGRFGSAYVARVPEDKLLDKTNYAYWDGKAWQANTPEAAAPIVDAPVSEMSVAYNRFFRRWLMISLDHNRAEILLREASQPTGPWSQPITLLSGVQYPGLYGGFIHPWSLDGPDLYLTMSRWGPYSVYLVRATLAADD